MFNICMACMNKSKQKQIKSGLKSPVHAGWHRQAASIF